MPDEAKSPMAATQDAAVLRDSTLEQVVVSLRRIPESIEIAVNKLPAKGGFYAWWGKSACIPTVPSRSHPTNPEFEILYVGIAPSSDRSPATIRSRVTRNHLNGNLAASTLRLSLAALLQAQLGLLPLKTTSKVVLSSAQNKQLSEWQRTNLFLTWHPVANPWELEANVIAQLTPPLNLDDNLSDPFYGPLKKRRAAFRASAR